MGVTKEQKNLYNERVKSYKQGLDEIKELFAAGGDDADARAHRTAVGGGALQPQVEGAGVALRVLEHRVGEPVALVGAADVGEDWEEKI